MRKWLRTSVALLAMLAMLAENTVSVYASMEGTPVPEETVQEADQELEVVTEEAVESEEQAPDSEEIVADETEEPEEAASEENTEEEEDTGEEEAGVVSASVASQDDRVAVEGVDDFTFYINTDEMNDSDHFKLAFTEGAVPFMDDALFGTMSKENGGIYNVSELNKEPFELWVDTVSAGMTVKYEVREDEYPQITLSSAPEAEVQKSLETSGNAVYGAGYTELHISVNTTDLPDDTYYAMHIETDAAVKYDGETLSDNVIETISNRTEDIYLSNLDKEDFRLYIKGESTDEVGAEYFVDSVENGALRMSLNMDGENDVEDEGKIAEVKATIVDEFGDKIDDAYTDMELPEFKDGELTLDDVDNPPVADVEVSNAAATLIKYTYVRATIDKKVIKALKREEMKDAQTGEKGFVYYYTEDGEQWKGIRKDTTLLLTYSDGKKTVYEYEDDQVSVTATLQHANAIPDDAEFIVTPITSDSEGYNYDVYMQALSENAEEILGEDAGEDPLIDEQDVLLYDIGFFITDEEGNRKELQPADGAVKISINFKKNQLEEELGSTEETELTVVHLPLADEVKENIETTEEATEITTEDIKVEVVSNKADAGSESLNFTLSDFSPVAVIGSNGKVYPGEKETFETVLGAGVGYGIVANEVTMDGDFESTIAVGTLHGNKDVKSSRNKQGAAGTSIIAAYDGSKMIYDRNGENNTNSDLYIYTTEKALKNMGTDMYNPRNNPPTRAGVTVDYTTYTEQQMRDIVSGLINDAKTTSQRLYNRNSYLFSKAVTKDPYNNFYTLDLTKKGNGPGTYYFTFDKGEFAQYFTVTSNTNAQVHIVLGEGQNIVFNIPDEEVVFTQYQIKLPGYEGGTHASNAEDLVCQSIIYNAPYAKKAYCRGASSDGVHLVPNAEFTNDVVSAGWVVAKKILKIGGNEWHNVWHDMPSDQPTVEVIKARKTVNGQKPNANQKFTFRLYAYGDLPDGSYKNGELIDEQQNNGEWVTFAPRVYKKLYDTSNNKTDIYGYKIVEIPNDNDGFNNDPTVYILKHNVTKDGNKMKAVVRYVAKKENGKENNVGSSYDKILFNNTLPCKTTYEVPVTKLFYVDNGTDWTAKALKDIFPKFGDEWPDGATFTFKIEAFDGGSTNTGIMQNPPMPVKNGKVNTTVTLTKDKQTDSFGTITFDADFYNGYNGSGSVVKYKVYMYKITEVIPKDADKFPGVQYTTRPVYLKLFVNSIQEYGKIGVEVSDHVSYVNDNAVEHCFSNSRHPLEFVNAYYPGKLKIKKVVKDQQGNLIDNDKDFHVVVYTKDNKGVKTYYKVNGEEDDKPQPVVVKGNNEVTFSPLKSGRTYYVYETDAEGNPVTEESIEYEVSYEGLSNCNSVQITTQQLEREVTITNKKIPRGVLVLKKKGGLKDENPVDLGGTTFYLYKKAGNDYDPVYVSGDNGSYTYSNSTEGQLAVVTADDGSFRVEELPLGDYYVKEMSLADQYKDGFVPYEDSIYFKVAKNATTLVSPLTDKHVSTVANGVELTMTVYNERRPVAIEIQKDLTAAKPSGTVEKQDKSGYVFYLYDVTDPAKREKVDTVTTDAAGYAAFKKDLKYGHSYEIEEDTAIAAEKGTMFNSLNPSKFTIDDTYYVNAKTEKLDTITYIVKNTNATNQEVRGKIRLIKTKADGVTKITEGRAKFVLSTQPDFSDEQYRVTVSGSDGDYKFYSKTSNTFMETVNGELTVDDLTAGTYYFFEIASPDDNQYVYTSGQPYDFTIDAEEAFRNKTSVIELISDEDAVKVPNSEFTAQLKFKKVNAYNYEQLLGVNTKFELFATDAQGAKTGESLGKTSVQNGVVTVVFPKAGTYVLEETDTQSGYVHLYENEPLKIYLEVSKDYNNRTDLTLQDVNATARQGGRTLDAAGIVDYVFNGVKNEPELGKVTLHKKLLDKNGEEIPATTPYTNLIGEATFELYTNSPEFKLNDKRYAGDYQNTKNFVKYYETVGGTQRETFTTSQLALTIENLPWGDYYFKEIATVKDGENDVYLFDADNEYHFTIGAGVNGDLQLEINDSFTDKDGKPVTLVKNDIKTGSAKIIKRDSVTENGIAGVRFELYRVNMNADSSYTPIEKIALNPDKTGADGSLTVTGLEYGTYYFVESENQDITGYEFDTTTRYFFYITEQNKEVTDLYYVVNNEQQHSPNGYIDNTPRMGKVSLDKWAIARGTTADPEYLAKLAGAEFELYSNNPTTVGQQILAFFSGDENHYLYKEDGNGTYVTGTDGTLEVSGLKWGTYYFVETKAPQGYAMPADPAERTYYFTIDGSHLDVHIRRPEGTDANDELSGKVPVNEKLNGSLKLIKKNSETEEGMGGVAFRLFKDGKDYTASLDKDRNRTNKINYTFKNGTTETLLVTNAAGEITVEELPWGTYYFKEAEVPEGFTAITVDSGELVINAANASAEAKYDTTNTVEMINTPIRGDLLLKKVDNNGNALTGATFDLVRVDNGAYHKVKVTGQAGAYTYEGVESADYRGGSIGQSIVEFVTGIFTTKKGDLETNADAILTVAQLPYGHYEIYEITPPDGYEPKKDDPVIIRDFDIDGEPAEGPDATVEFVNTKVYAGVQFVKTADEEQLKGARFVLQQFVAPEWQTISTTVSKKDTYYRVDDPDNHEIGEFESVVTFSGLPVGDYRIYEVSDCVNTAEAVNTYPYLNANGKEIWSEPDENTNFYNFKITMSDSGKYNVGLDNKDGTLIGYDAEKVINTPKQGKAKLLKVEGLNGTTAISGAKFALFHGKADNNGNHILGDPNKDTRIGEELTSNADGEVITGDLNWGSYYLVETKTSDTRYFLPKKIEDRVQYHFTIAPDADGNFKQIVTEFVAMQDGKDDVFVTTATNEKIKGLAEFSKRDSETLGLIQSEKITFDLYYKATETAEYAPVLRYSGENALNAADGWIRTNKDLDAGYYYFVEMTTEDGYEALPENVEDRVKYKFEIKQKDDAKSAEDFEIVWGGQIAGTDDGKPYVTNKPIPGSVTLFKYYVLDGAEKPLANAEFKLVGKTLAGDNYSEVATSNTNGEVSFTNVPWGTYEVKEVKTPAGYKLPDGVQLPKNIVINKDKLDHDFRSASDATLKVLNERKPGKLSLKKVDDKGNAVAGVAFELQKKTGDTWTKISNPKNPGTGYFVTGEGGFLSFFNLVTKKGEIEIDNLEWGTYRVLEREVPEGYQLMTEPITDQDGNSEFYVGAENMTDETHLEYDLGEVENKNIHGNIGLKKIDKAGNGLGGAEFVLFQAKDNNPKARPVYVKKTAEGVYAYVSMDEAKAAETEGATLTLVSPGRDSGVVGKIKVTGLPCGEYYMQETKEPDPLTVDGQTIIYQKNTNLIGKFEVVVDQAAEDPEQSENSKTWTNDAGNFRANVLFYKTDDAAAGMDGVEYKVTNKDTPLSSWSVFSGQEGSAHGVVRISFTGTGTYTIQEVSVPDDAYELDTNVYEIQITTADNGQTIDLADRITVPSNSKFVKNKNTFVNPPAKGGVKLVKTESESSGDDDNTIGTLNNVTFTLFKVDANNNRTPVTRGGNDKFITATVGTESGVIRVSDLEWGSYVFVEDVPEDYEGDVREYPFVINRDTFKKDQKIEVVEAVNKRKPGSLLVQKFFENPEPDFNGEGVAFTLELKAGTSDIAATYKNTVVTKKDKNGNYFVNFEGLPWGVYTLSEGEPKEGYIKYTGTRTVKIGNAKNSVNESYDVQGLNVELLGEQDPTALTEDVTKGILNRKIKGSVKLQKVDSVKKAPVVVSFKLYKGAHPEQIGSTTTGLNPIIMTGYTDEQGVFTTDSNGFFTFPEKSLEYGDYYLEEQVPEGYEGYADGAFTYRGVYFKITSDQTVQLTKDADKAIVNTPDTGSVKLQKVDGKGKPIKGVKFTLYAHDAQDAGTFDLLKSAISNLVTGEDGVIYAILETDENGKVEISGMPWGTYHFTEELPAGFTLSDTEKAKVEKPFYIGSKDNTLTLKYDLGMIKNEPIPGSVKLTKKGQDTENNTIDLLAGAQFSLYKVNGVQDVKPGEPAGEDLADELLYAGLETSADSEVLGTIEVKDLAWGQYYFVETKAPTGYEMSTDKPEVLTVGRPGEAGKTYTDISVKPITDAELHPETTVINKKGYGYTALYKVFEVYDETGKPVDPKGLDLSVEKDGTSLTFEIYALDEDGNPTGEPVTAKYGMNSGTEFPVHQDTLMTDVIGPLPYGEYAFVEKRIPTNVDYTMDQSPKPFKIDAYATRDNIIHEMNAASPDHAFSFVTKFINTTFRGWASIAKTDITSGDFVAGVNFRLYEVIGTSAVIELGTKYGDYKTKDNGVATADGLPLGRYAFVEDAESAKALGYIASDSAYVFEITPDIVRNNARPELKEATKNEDGTYTVTDETVESVGNERISGSIKLTKKGKDSKPLAGATFNLWKIAGLRDNVPGKAENGDLADELITVNGTTALVTDATGQIYVDELAWGTYYFDEIIPPKGYTLLARPNHEAKTIGKETVTATAEVVMEDTPIRLDITKTDITGNKELEGADMAIYPADSETALISWTSTTTPKRIEIGDTFEGLTATVDASNPVIYLLRETHAPAGYTVTADIYFSVDTTGAVTLYKKGEDGKYTASELENAVVTTLTDGGAAREIPLLTVKDDTSIVKITKRELGTKRYLPGATLAIYDEANYKLYEQGGAGAVAIDTWTTASSDLGEAHAVIGKLEASNGVKHVYYLVETKVPAGYFKAAPIAFTVNNDNEITLIESNGDSSGEVSLDKKLLIMYDRPIYVKITKKVRTKDTVLAGALLEVTDQSENSYAKFTTVDKPALLVPVTEDEANSAAAKEKYDKLAETYQLIFGAKFNTTDLYTLTELSAPEGYQIAAPQTFSIDVSKKEFNKSLGIYETEMLDEPIKLYISKKDLTGKQELAGATMSIYEKNGDAMGEKPVITWTSSSKPYLVSISDDQAQGGILKRGQEYWLVEDGAPVGYALADKIPFMVNANGTIASDEFEEVNGEKIRKITMQDEPLALTVNKKDSEGRKLTGAEFELRTSPTETGGELIAKWVSDGKIAFISEHAKLVEQKDLNTYTQVALEEGKHLLAGVTYYVIEKKAPEGYVKSDLPLPVKAVKLSEATKSANLIDIPNPKFGPTSISGTKTWKVTPELYEQLVAENKKIKINLYRYYVDEKGDLVYISKNGEVVTKEQGINDTIELIPSPTPVQYVFDNLDKYFYHPVTGKAYEYIYELGEDLNGLEDLISSKKAGNNFENFQRYKKIEGDKKWILFRDGDNIIDIDSDEELKEALARLGKDSETAYVNVDIALATLDKDGNATILDKNGDGKADYYVTIRHGAKEDKLVDRYEVEEGHITIVWTKPGQVHFGFEKLPAFDDYGNEIQYAFVEKPSKAEDEGRFEIVYSNERAYGTNGTLITNKPLVDPFTIRGQKLWKDPYDKDPEKRPEVTIQLYRDGVAMEGYRATLTAKDNYRFEFKGLYEFDFDQKKDAHRYVYELKEEGATGDYAIEINFNGKITTLESGERVKDVTVTNKIKPKYISIDGTKKWRNTDTTKVPEVTINLYKLTKDAAGKDVKEFLDSRTIKNAKNNTYSFTNLPKYDDDGKLIVYKVEEDLTNLQGYKSTPEGGYTIDTSDGLVKYTGKDFENTPTYFRVRKTDMTTRKILPGAVMRVIDKNKKEVDRWTTTNEDHYVEGLIYGETYTLEEVTAPKGYMKISPITFTVDEKFLNTKDETDPTIVEDPPINGKVTLTKRDATTRDTLSGAVFNLFTSDGKAVHVTGSTGSYDYSEDGTAATALSVNSAGTLSVEKLPYGTYYFKEITAPTGYTLNTSTERFTISESGAEVTVTFLNERARGAVTLRKAGPGGSRALSGAVFELYAATPRTPGQAAASTIYSDAYYRYGTYTTGADGTITVRDLPWDDYYFIETEAPSGYVTNTDVNGDPLVYTFTIDSSTAASVAVSLGTIINNTEGGGGGGGGSDTAYTGGGTSPTPTPTSEVAGARRKRNVSDVLGVRAKPSSGVLGVRVGPVTGDAANIALWLLLLVASISVIVVIAIQNHKRKRRA